MSSMRVLSLEGHSESASPAADDRCRDAQASKLNDDICANRCGCNAFKPGPAKGHIEQSIDYQSPGRLYLCRVARGSRSDERRRGCSTHIRQASAKYHDIVPAPEQTERRVTQLGAVLDQECPDNAGQCHRQEHDK
jgi:hypothetical protein